MRWFHKGGGTQKRVASTELVMGLPLFDELPPFQGKTPQTRHASYTGAVVAVRRATSQASRMLVLYLERGSSTDGELASIMGLPEGRISARRSGLMKLDLVQYCDVVQGPHGAKCCRFCLTVRGVHAAGRLKGEANG